MKVEIKVAPFLEVEKIEESEYLTRMLDYFKGRPVDDRLRIELDDKLKMVLDTYGSKYKYHIDPHGNGIIYNNLPEIIHHGIAIDNTQECEFVSQKGFNVRIEYYNDRKFGVELELLSDITEVHYLFESPFLQVAFESSILFTGFTRFVQYIKKIEIN